MAKRLKRFRVSGEVTISVTTIVKARDEKHALEVASQVQTSTGVVDSGDEEGEWVCGGDLDGDVKPVEAKEVKSE